MTDKRQISGDEFDRMFDHGADIDAYIDWSSASRPGSRAEHVAIEFPHWLVARIDDEAERQGLTRQALLERWLTERLDSAA